MPGKYSILPCFISLQYVPLHFSALCKKKNFCTSFDARTQNQTHPNDKSVLCNGLPVQCVGYDNLAINCGLENGTGVSSNDCIVEHFVHSDIGVSSGDLLHHSAFGGVFNDGGRVGRACR